ncbi:MAG: cupin domain-containing protein [Halioglobus sp.]
MSEREDFVLTNDARVASIALAGKEASPWHYHNHVLERVVCVSGSIEVQCSGLGSSQVLMPGEIALIESGRKHRLVNLLSYSSTYLLVQSGEYDFVPVNS